MMEPRTLTLAGVISKANNPQHHTPIDYGPPSRMTDDKIKDLHAELTAQVVNIGRQLADDLEMNCGRGDAWRKRAMGARRAYLALLDKLIPEGVRRGLIAVAPPTPTGLNGAPLPSPDSFRVAERKEQVRSQQAAVQEEISKRKAAEAEQKAERLRIEAANVAARLEMKRISSENQAARLAAKAAEKAALMVQREESERRLERHFIVAARELLGADACCEIWARAKEMAAITSDEQTCG